MAKKLREQASRSLGSKIMSLFQRFAKDEFGATAIEYGLIAAGIAVVIIVAVQNLGSNLRTVFNNVAGNIK